MDFLKGFLPSNPIDADKRERIAKIAKDVMVTFGKEYLLATKDVILESAEEKVSKLEKKKAKWEKKHAKREKKRAEHGLPPGNEVFDEAHCFDEIPYDDLQRMCIEDLNNGLACHRPRDKKKKKEKPEKKRKIRFEIVGYEMCDLDSDPYVAYVVSSTLGTQSAQKNRRYTQFKALHKAVGKKFAIKAPFPSASSVWGGRNLSPEFIGQRMKELNTYMSELVEVPDAETNEDVLAFFGLSKIDDPLSYEIEMRAIDATLHDLWLGGLIYDDLVDGMTKIVIIKIKEDMWQDIVSQVPNNEKVRKVALKAANKTLDTVVAPIVEAGIRTAKEGSAPVRKKLMDCLEQLGVTIVKAKHDVYNKLNEAMSSVLSPIVGALSQLVTRIIGCLLPVILRPIAPTLQSIVSTGDALIDVFAQNDEKKVDELEKAIEDAANGIADKVKDSMKDAVASLVGDRDKLVMNPVLNGIMVLLELVVDFVKDVFMVVFNVKPWFKTLRHMMRWKEDMLKADPTNPEEVYKIMDKHYDDMEDVIEDDSIDFMICARAVWYTFKCLPGKAGLFAGVMYDLFDDCRVILHDKFFKRFSKKFIDYIWGTYNLSADARDWKTKVDHSFALAFRSGVNHSLKRLNKLIIKRVVCVLETPILNAVEEHVKPLIHDALDPINKAIPEAVAEFLDVEGMVNGVIDNAIHSSCKRIVKDQEGIFKQEFSLAVGFVYGAPFLPSYPPFPYVYVTAPNGAVVAVPAAAALPAAPVMMAPVDPAAMAAAPMMMNPVDPAAMAAAPMMANPVDPAMGGAPMMANPVDPAMGGAPMMANPVDPAMGAAPMMANPVDPAMGAAPMMANPVDPAAMAAAPMMADPAAAQPIA